MTLYVFTLSRRTLVKYKYIQKFQNERVLSGISKKKHTQTTTTTELYYMYVQGFASLHRACCYYVQVEVRPRVSILKYCSFINFVLKKDQNM